MRRAGAALALAVAVAGCAKPVEHDASSMALGTCGGTATYSDRAPDSKAVIDLDALLDRTVVKLTSIRRFATKTSNEISIHYDEDGDNDEVILSFDKEGSTATLATPSKHAGNQDYLTLAIPKEGQVPDISYGALACTEDGHVFPTRAVEYIDDMYHYATNATKGD